ncbi:MAG: Crp/Fnr family transcriptional regulator [Pseudomonadota bacterium]
MQSFKAGELVVEAGSPVLLQGATSPYIFTVLKGWAQRNISLEDGRRQVVNFVFPGDFIGLQSAILGEMGHSVEAVTEMTLCVFTKDRFWDLFKNSPERAYDLTWIASREERMLGDTLATVGRKTAQERVAYALSSIYRRSKAQNLLIDGAAPMPWKQQDLADALGLSLVHTNKTLRRLREQQLAEWRGDELRVHDLGKLSDVGHYDLSATLTRPLI